MSKEKQIEEIWDILTTDCDRECVGCEFENDEWCFTRFVANKLYNAGYRKQSEWISVEERLPKESGWCLANIITPFGLDFMSLSHYSKGYGWNSRDTVTHWMPLPEPPKMEGGAE